MKPLNDYHFGAIDPNRLNHLPFGFDSDSGRTAAPLCLIEVLQR
jgi:hypothetical protein